MSENVLKGYRLAWGIWNFEHSITSRDVGRPEVHETMDKINEVIRDKNINYASMGYALWFTKIDEVDICLCKCGKYCEVKTRCWYCGTE